MRTKPVVLRRRADQDIQDGVAFYLEAGGEMSALGFLGALEKAMRHLGRFPSTGSDRYAHELDLPGLRSWPVPHYPWLVFYLDGEDRVDVWRVLDGRRDIPAWLDKASGSLGKLG